MNKADYFLQLHAYAINFFNALPIEKTPQPLDYSLNKLKPVIESLKAEEVRKLGLIERPFYFIKDRVAANGQGLNSVGMLADRFTILLIKEWSLKNKTNNFTKAAEIYNTQTLDIIEAMSLCNPGSSSMNTKITNIKADSKASSWEEAFYGLLTINLILWESQEVLYIKDISILPCEELRDYLKWFSWGNIIRNEYIQLCEEFFWKQ